MHEDWVFANGPKNMMTMIVPEGTQYFPSVAALPGEMLELLERLAHQYGETYDAYLATDKDRETFWSCDRRAVVSFVRWGRRWTLVVGGLLADREDREQLVADFVRFARLNRLHVTFFNIGRDDLALFRAHGFQITKCGEEPIVRLDRTEWRGKDYEWLRRQESFCKRQGLEMVEVRPDPGDPEYRDRIAPQLADLSREHIAGTLHGHELRHFVGRFDPLDMGRRRLFVARRGETIEAFVVCNPCLGGSMWAVETYRRRKDATRGVVPFAILQAMRLLKQEGVLYCSLSLIPCVRCELRMRGDSVIWRGFCIIWWRWLNWMFDVKGIYHFKSRFRPEYREMYSASLPNVTVLSMIAVGMTWGLLKISPWRLLGRSVRKLSMWERRKTLAAPDWRPKRLLRRLISRSRDAEPASAEASPEDASDKPAGCNHPAGKARDTAQLQAVDGK